MKRVKVESKEIVKASKSRRVAGVQVRSGIKAGLIGPTGPMPGDGGGGGDHRNPSCIGSGIC